MVGSAPEPEYEKSREMSRDAKRTIRKCRPILKKRFTAGSSNRSVLRTSLSALESSKWNAHSAGGSLRCLSGKKQLPSSAEEGSFSQIGFLLQSLFTGMHLAPRQSMQDVLLIVLFGAVVLLAYTYFGYPLAIGALARFFPACKTVASRAEEAWPMVSALLCVHNGAGFLPAKIESLLAQDYPRDRLEILVYCDGSTDNTVAVAEMLAAQPAAADR